MSGEEFLFIELVMVNDQSQVSINGTDVCSMEGYIFSILYSLIFSHVTWRKL